MNPSAGCQGSEQPTNTDTYTCSQTHIFSPCEWLYESLAAYVSKIKKYAVFFSFHRGEGGVKNKTKRKKPTVKICQFARLHLCFLLTACDGLNGHNEICRVCAST